ncbi:hypothetical protein HNY73_006688 [Argiope bruennichi]|uniref:Uncharacterized protein n=1 Tax=Argiope bruennichi TaxID=94029 RepID=A0A8T0FEC0_ARGBR|nr:hypothetical protein HNY73_006688 [Argiope bruennichi]
MVLRILIISNSMIFFVKELKTQILAEYVYLQEIKPIVTKNIRKEVISNRIVKLAPSKISIFLSFLGFCANALFL